MLDKEDIVLILNIIEVIYMIAESGDLSRYFEITEIEDLENKLNRLKRG